MGEVSQPVELIVGVATVLADTIYLLVSGIQCLPLLGDFLDLLPERLLLGTRLFLSVLYLCQLLIGCLHCFQAIRARFMKLSQFVKLFQVLFQAFYFLLQFYLALLLSVQFFGGGLLFLQLPVPVLAILNQLGNLFV